MMRGLSLTHVEVIGGEYLPKEGSTPLNGLLVHIPAGGITVYGTNMSFIYSIESKRAD